MNRIPFQNWSSDPCFIQYIQVRRIAKDFIDKLLGGFWVIGDELCSGKIRIANTSASFKCIDQFKRKSTHHNLLSISQSIEQTHDTISELSTQ